MQSLNQFSTDQLTQEIAVRQKAERKMRRDRQELEWAPEFLERLQKITKNCGLSMHEPDESKVSAKVFGNRLDNAFGDLIDEGSKYQEFVVSIKNGNTNQTENFNLACLIALARLANLEQFKL